MAHVYGVRTPTMRIERMIQEIPQINQKVLWQPFWSIIFQNIFFSHFDEPLH
jgi:hypothetical protein